MSKAKIIKELFDLKISDEQLRKLDVIMDIYTNLSDIIDRLDELVMEDKTKKDIVKAIKQILKIIKGLKK